jgi:hypothetical protein
MYRDHVPLINAAMRASPDNFVRGVMFAVLSARQPFTSVWDNWCHDVATRYEMTAEEISAMHLEIVKPSLRRDRLWCIVACDQFRKITPTFPEEDIPL